MKRWKGNIETLKFQSIIKEKKKLCIFDVETTGLNKTKDRIIQFSAIMVAPDQFGIYREIDYLDLYIKQPVYMTQEVINIHHITNEFLEDKPLESEVAKRIYDFMIKADVISGYNIVKFDMAFINALFDRAGLSINIDIVDIYPFALESFDRRDYEKMNLETLCTTHNINAIFHSAIDDVRACYKLMQFMIHRAAMERIVPDGPKITSITNVTEFKKGKTVNRLYFDFINEFGQKGKGHYDRWNLSWELDKKSNADGNLKDACILITEEASKVKKNLNNYTGRPA